MIEIQDFKEDDGVRVEEQMSWIVDIELYLWKVILWFQIPLELPSVLKSQQAVAKGSRISF